MTNGGDNSLKYSPRNVSSLYITVNEALSPLLIYTSFASPHHQVKLTDSLMSAVGFSQARDSELAWVDGNVQFTSAAPSGFKGQGEGSGDGVQQRTPLLNALPHNQVGVQPRNYRTVDDFIINLKGVVELCFLNCR